MAWRRFTKKRSGDNARLLESVTLQRRIDAGAWDTVRKVVYDYYDSDEDHGNLGDLKTASILDGADNVLETTYYRYCQAGEADGYEHGLKFVFGGQFVCPACRGRGRSRTGGR